MLSSYKDLENKTNELLIQADKLKKLIEGHEFSYAALVAANISFDSNLLNEFANKVAE